MPVEHKSYGCKFRCGRSWTSNRRAMEEHEAICFSNTESRSCRTCKHDIDLDRGFACALKFNDSGKQIKQMCSKWEEKNWDEPWINGAQP